MAMRVLPLDGPFGVAVEGIDLARDADETMLRTLIGLLHANGVLVIRGQRLSDAEYARFGRAWGTPLTFFIQDHRRNDFPEMIRISNAASTPMNMRDGAVHWHSDSSYEEVPASVTMLLGAEIPEQGGETLFAGTALAYAALSDETKARIERRFALHRLGGAPWVEGEVIPASDRPQRDLPVVRHPLVMPHPATGKLALFLSGTAFAIDGMDEEEARALIVELRRHVVRPEFRLTYKIGVGELLLWDNFSTVHSATEIEYSDEDGRRRLLYRISTKGMPALLAVP